MNLARRRRAGRLACRSGARIFTPSITAARCGRLRGFAKRTPSAAGARLADAVSTSSPCASSKLVCEIERRPEGPGASSSALRFATSTRRSARLRRQTRIGQCQSVVATAAQCRAACGDTSGSLKSARFKREDGGRLGHVHALWCYGLDLASGRPDYGAGAERVRHPCP